MPPSKHPDTLQISTRPAVYKFPSPPPFLPLLSLDLAPPFFLLLHCRCRLRQLAPAMMDRALLSICLLLPFLFSVGHATLNFHDVWNLVLPHSHSTEEALPNQIPHGVTTSLPTPGEAGDDSSAGGVSDHPQYLVDFGNKAWPNVYYSRRDRLGTLDWGTKSWPYIYYTSREDKYFPSAKSNAAAGEPADASHGRKLGKAFRLY